MIVSALDGFPPDELEPDLTFRIERLGSFIDELVRRGVSEVCFAGAIRRPQIDPNTVDEKTQDLLPGILDALRLGDDAALRLIITMFEEAGLTIRAAHEIAPDLLPPHGVLTEIEPENGAVKDAQMGAKVIEALGRVDVGQACVVSSGKVIAVETITGTDWMLSATLLCRDGKLLRRFGAFLEAVPGTKIISGTFHKMVGVPLTEALGFGPDVPGGGLLYKAPKPDQDRRVDLPTIGPETIKGARFAGLDGVVIEANGVIVLDLEEVVQLADDANMFLWVRRT